MQNGVIVHSDLLLEYLKKHYPHLYFVSSTTKVITDFKQLVEEIRREDFRYVVPDFRLNKAYDRWKTLSWPEKDKVEFLCNECCWFGCKDRKACYEAVSRKNLGENREHHCTAPESEQGYCFSKAMQNPGFIGIEAIQNVYFPMGFSNFKIEGRGLGSALILEFLLYYMTKPQYQLHVREEIYLDNMLDLFLKNVLKLLVIWNKGEIQENESIIYDSSNIFCRYGSRTWNRFCRDECGSGYQPDAYHISWDGAVYGGRDCAVF